MEVDVEERTRRECPSPTSSPDTSPGWRSLFAFTTRKHLPVLSLALTLSVASGILVPALAYLLGKLFDCFTKFGAGIYDGSELVKKVSTYSIALTVLGSLSGILNAGYFALWLVFGELQAKCARDRLFEDMLRKDMEWYDMRKDGVEALIQRLQT